MHASGNIALRHLLVDDALPRSHPLHVARPDYTAVAEAVAVFDCPGEHVGDRLDATVRMPGEPCQVVARNVVAKVIQEQKGS